MFGLRGCRWFGELLSVHTAVWRTRSLVWSWSCVKGTFVDREDRPITTTGEDRVVSVGRESNVRIKNESPARLQQCLEATCEHLSVDLPGIPAAVSGDGAACCCFQVDESVFNVLR